MGKWFLIMLAMVLTGRFLANRALYELGDEDKLRVVEGMRGFQQWSDLPMVIYLVVFLFFQQYLGAALVPFLLGYPLLALVGKVAYLVGRTGHIGLPRSYRLKFIAGHAIASLGVILLLWGVFLGW